MMLSKRKEWKDLCKKFQIIFRKGTFNKILLSKSSENSNVNLFVIDIDDVEIDFEKKFVGFRQGLINNDILKSVKHSKTLCVINKIDKAVGRKFPPTICEMKSQIEDIKEFVFTCKVYSYYKPKRPVLNDRKLVVFLTIMINSSY